VVPPGPEAHDLRARPIPVLPQRGSATDGDPDEEREHDPEQAEREQEL
jgi:hypothetical protein